MATAQQVRIAEALGVDVSADSESVAAARLLDEIAFAIGERIGRRPVTERQLEFGRQLGLSLAADSLRVASAKLLDELRRRSVDALKRLDLKPGDRVRKRTVLDLSGKLHEDTQEFVISSIQPNTRVLFKGRYCQGAWPTQLEKVDVQEGECAHPGDSSRHR